MPPPPPEELSKHAGFLRALAYRLVGDHARAEDLVQEAYVAALERPPRGALRAWLGAVVRNLAGKLRRAEGRRRRRERLAPSLAPLPGPDDVAARIELHRNLVQAVDALEEPYRSTIVLRFLYDLPPRDVAARQGIPVATVRTRTQRALEMLRGRIDRKSLALALLPLPVLKAGAGPALTWGIVMAVKRRLVFALVLLALVGGGALTLLLREAAEVPRPDGGRARADVARNGVPEALAGDAPAATDARVPAAPEMVVRGLVLLDGAPVPGAEVALRGAAEAVPLYDVRTQAYRRITVPLSEALARTRTDADGSFVLHCPARAALTVEAIAAGAVPLRRLVYAPLAEDLTLCLQRATDLAGRVVDEAGAPVGGATVRWSVWDGNEDVRGATVTDPEGRFTAPAGRIWLHVLAEGYAPATANARQAVRIVLERGGRVAGVVRTAAGAPVAGALVLLATEHVPAETRTDAQGRYALRMPAGHLVHALVDAPGWLPLGSWTDELPLPPRPVVAGGELAFDITLPPAAPLHGTVVHADAPVPNARVTLVRVTTRWPVPVGETVSDALGRFAFPEVPDGTYELRAVSGALRGKAGAGVVDAAAPPDVQVALAPTGRIEGAVSGALPVERVYLGESAHADVDALGRFVFEDVAPTEAACVRVPGTTVRSEPFPVRAGATAYVTLDTAAAQVLRGRVVDADGAPVAGARVALLDQREYAYQPVWLSVVNQLGTLTDRDGRFTSAVPDGLLMAVVHHPDAAPLRIFDVDPDGDELRITLQPGHAVSGRVVWPGGAPVAGIEVRVRPFEQQQLDVVPDTSWQEFPTGEFVLRGLGEGTVTVEVRHPDATAAPRTVATGTAGLVVELRRTFSIRGAVVDRAGRPVRAAKITARAPGRKDVVAYSTHQGRFEIAHLDDGSWDLHLEPGTQSDWYPPQRTPFLPTVVAGIAAGTGDVVVEVDTGREVTGVVRGPNGSPVVGAFVAALGPPGALPPTARTGAGGRFTLRGLAAVHEELLVRAMGFPARAVALADGELEITLAEGETLRLRFLGPDGRPVADHWINVGAETPALAKQAADWRARLGEAGRDAGGLAGGAARTDADGRVEIPGLAPGTYRVYGFRIGDGIVPETVVRTGEPARTVQLERAYSVAGHVVDPDGRAVGSVPGKSWIYVTAYRDGSSLRGVNAATDGSFRIDGLTAGPVHLLVSYAGPAPGYHGEADVQAGADDVRLVVTRGP